MVQIQYSAREVAELLAEATREAHPCNIGSVYGWLPYCCDFGEECFFEHQSKDCWLQYLKHLPEREAVLSAIQEQEDYFMSDDFACDECTSYGDDYSFDDDGDLVSNCGDCPHAIWNRSED